MFATLSILVALVGCGDSTNKDGDTGSNNPGGDTEPGLALACDVSETDFGREDALPLGTSAAELMAGIAGTTASDAFYLDGTETQVTVSIIEGDGPVVFVEQSVTGTSDKDATCFDYVRVPISIVITTADGALDFDLEAQLSVESSDVFLVNVDPTLEDNAGSHTLSVGPTETGSYRIEQQANGDDVRGKVYSVIEGTDGDVAYIGQDELITWPESE
jgi:hypothetical protein